MPFLPLHLLLLAGLYPGQIHELEHKGYPRAESFEGTVKRIHPFLHQPGCEKDDGGSWIQCDPINEDRIWLP